MTDDARIERIEPDVWGARAFLQQAQRFLGDGANESLSAEGRQVLLHTAAIAACDAVLAVSGRRVEGVLGGHQLRLTEALALLGAGGGELFERLDDARMDRNEISYRAAPMAPPDVADGLPRCASCLSARRRMSSRTFPRI